MSRKHFNELAKAIAKVTENGTRKHLAQTIGEVCAGINDRFNWSKWNEACNVKETN